MIRQSHPASLEHFSSPSSPSLPSPESLRHSILLSSWVSQVVALQRRSGNWVGLCPFHQEKSPSFQVNDQRGTYHCFGCGAHGDIFDFVQQHQGLSFSEAMAMLAKEVCLPGKTSRPGHTRSYTKFPSTGRRSVPQNTQEPGNLEKAFNLLKRHDTPLAAPQPSESWRNPGQEKITPPWMYPLLQEGACWFQENLKKFPKVMDYVTQRGLKATSIDMFMMGFCSGTGLKDALSAKGFQEDQMRQGGLLGCSEKGFMYEVFHGRLMFPIWDRKGRVVAFGGRHLPERLWNSNAKDEVHGVFAPPSSDSTPRGPKYLNSATSPWFIKGESLYHLPRSLYGIRAQALKGPCVVVEGYLDVVALTEQACMAFAPLGTAMNAAHLKRLWSIHPHIIVCLDGDVAGQKASQKIALTALPLIQAGLNLSFVTLPGGHDPLSFIRAYGSENMKTYLREGKNLCAYLWDVLFGKPVSPEVLAQNKATWRQWISTIADRDIAGAYKDFFYRSWGAKTPKAQAPMLSPYFYHKNLLGLLVFFPWLLDRVYESLAFLEFPEDLFPPGNIWLTIRNFMLSWNNGFLLDDLFVNIGSLGCKDVFTLAQHFPQSWPKSLDSAYVSQCPPYGKVEVFHHEEAFKGEVEAHWNALFNAHQVHAHRPREIQMLRRNLSDAPETWERLKRLTTTQDA